MAPSKEWMNFISDRLNEKYKAGVQQFLDYAVKNKGDSNNILCPCVKCHNTDYTSREVVEMHLYVNGIMPNYTTWYHHGEIFCEVSSESEGSDCDEEIGGILRDLYPNMYGVTQNGSEFDHSSQNTSEEEPNVEAKTFYRLLNDSKQPSYPGCEISKLDATVNLLHIKSIGRWSNESFSMLLQFLRKLLPSGSTLPGSYYDVKKMMKDLGLSYEKIDACSNDCMLYRKEEAVLDKCKICGASRWKEDIHSREINVRENGKKVAVKTLRYFPLKPRLQRLFMCKESAHLMRWHHENRVDDGVMRHPADSMAWKSFDGQYKDFASEPRNVRLGLASDGFQPFTHSKSSYSIWPVLLIPYNLPPWLCMKDSNFILSMLIPGPEGPGDAIDVYLTPLIEELKELWDVGLETFDASTRTNFMLHASLLWTINDFPAYANLSGWSTKGKMACPCCNKETSSIRLANGHKQCYMSHRRYLPINHSWRKNKNAFDGTVEKRLAPFPVSGDEIIAQVDDLEGMILTKDAKQKVKISHEKRGDNWNKKSIFFDLPYWSSLLLRHNLDVMHIEKNICDNILGTIMNVKGKTKDNVQTRLDLKEMDFRPELQPILIGDKLHLPTASYTLSAEKKNMFYTFLKSLRVSDGFSSDISQNVNMKEHKISGLKSHDCHVLLQHLIPLGIRGLLPKEVCEPLIELSLFFASLGSKTLRINDLEKLETQIPITLCKLEQIFPPSFFDVMVHLPVHLPTEAKIGGPPQFRWMYSTEHMMLVLKQLIRNTSCPEGSIAEGYLAKECMTFCSRYLKGVKTKFSTLGRYSDGNKGKYEGELLVFSQSGRALGAGTTRMLNDDEWLKAHIYVLKNCDEVQPFFKEYTRIHASENDYWNADFISWFKQKVEKLPKENLSNELLSLSRGPTKYVTCYNGYVDNGYRFRIETCDSKFRSQNSGVCVVGDIGRETTYVNYYGVLTEVLELQYLDEKRLILFRCRWFDVFDNKKGCKIDEYGFTCINPNRLLKTNEPFILANQASQVFYAIDNMNKGWQVVVKAQPRNVYEANQLTNDENTNKDNLGEAYQHEESFLFECDVPTSLPVDGQTT